MPWDRLANSQPVAMPYYIPSILPGRIILEPGLNGMRRSGLGQIPSVPTGKGLPATSLALVDSIISRLPSKVKARFQAAKSASAFPAGKALEFLNAWALAAWKALGAQADVYQTLFATPIGWGTAGGTSVSVWDSLTYGGGLKEYFTSWKKDVDEFKKRWDIRHSAKEALRAYLRGLPEAQNLAAEERLETLRQAASYASLASEIGTHTEQERILLENLIKIRTAELPPGPFKALGQALGLIGDAVGQALRVIIMDAVAPLVGGLFGGLGLWGTLAIVAAGGVALYVVAHGNPLAMASRRLLGGVDGTRGQFTYEVRWRDKSGARKFNLYHSAMAAQKAMRSLKEKYGPAGVWVTKLPYSFGRERQ